MLLKTIRNSDWEPSDNQRLEFREHFDQRLTYTPRILWWRNKIAINYCYYFMCVAGTDDWTTMYMYNNVLLNLFIAT